MRLPEKQGNSSENRPFPAARLRRGNLRVALRLEPRYRRPMLSTLSPLQRLFVVLAAPLLLARAGSVDAAPPEDTFLRDYAETRGFMLGRPVKATPTPDGKAVIFLRAKSAREPSQELYEFNVASGQTRRLLAPEDALRKVRRSGSRPRRKARRERQRISVGGFTAFSISRDSALVLLQPVGQALRARPRRAAACANSPPARARLSIPSSRPTAGASPTCAIYDVYVFDLATGKERAVTTGGTGTVSHGLAEFVAQEEMDALTLASGGRRIPGRSPTRKAMPPRWKSGILPIRPSQATRRRRCSTLDRARRTLPCAWGWCRWMIRAKRSGSTTTVRNTLI